LHKGGLQKDQMSEYTFIQPREAFPLPPTFNFDDYIETERELWALFPETDGKRVNFTQIGLTAMLFAEITEKEDFPLDETYILMPCSDYTMRPIRMKAIRRLTLSEYRMSHLTAVKLIGKVNEAGEVMRNIGCEILGEEVMEESTIRLRQIENGEQP
jgi:hypothetical protein